MDNKKKNEDKNARKGEVKHGVIARRRRKQNACPRNERRSRETEFHLFRGLHRRVRVSASRMFTRLGEIWLTPLSHVLVQTRLLRARRCLRHFIYRGFTTVAARSPIRLELENVTIRRNAREIDHHHRDQSRSYLLKIRNRSYIVLLRTISLHDIKVAIFPSWCSEF